MPQSGTVFDDRYKVIRSLGQGGFATTFLAEDTQTGESVVLKFPDVTQLGDPAVYERFRREIAIGKLLKHPDLPLARAYSEGNPPYLVISYAEGESLANIIHQKQKFALEDAVELIANLLEVLQYCHEKGIYHRDLKPENLLVGTDGRLKIIDFGIAGMDGAPRVTYRGFSSLMGTPEYMSPEQIKGERCGPKGDIYAVGCILYHLLAGKPPFTGDNPLTIMYQHMNGKLKPLDELPPGIWAAISRALRRRKEERYDTAMDMANDLRHPEGADLSWINKPDPPLTSVVTAKKTSLYILTAGIILVLILTLVIIMALK